MDLSFIRAARYSNTGGASHEYLEAILDAQGGAAAREAGRSVGLSQDQTSTALAALVPALAAGLQRNATQQGGLDALLGALGGGGHARYVDQPSMLWSQETVTDGNSILGHVLGNKDVSRAVATQASAQTGIGADVLKRLLPIAATLGWARWRNSIRVTNEQSHGRWRSLQHADAELDGNRDGSVVAIFDTWERCSAVGSRRASAVALLEIFDADVAERFDRLARRWKV